MEKMELKVQEGDVSLDKFTNKKKGGERNFERFCVLLENVMKCCLEHVNVAHQLQLLEPRYIFDATKLCWVLDSKATVESRLQAL
jgi:hypothetical protein